jgi:pimeloyl-ACP methyl ester carboxylesterase
VSGIIGHMTIDLTRRVVRNGDVELAVFEGGRPDGPTLVLVHGWPDTHHVWLRLMAELADEFHLVAYDTRGQGESGYPGADEAFTLAQLATDFLAVADAVSPERPVHVLAHDWGSTQVWEAVGEPGIEQRVASFTSISGPHLDHVASWVRRQLTSPTPKSVARLLAQGLSSAYVPFFLSPLAPPVFSRVVTRERWKQVLRRSQGVQPADEDVADTLAADLVSGLRYYRANVGGLRRPGGRRTAVPVLLLVPTRDTAIRSYVLDEVPLWADRLERRDLPYGHWVVLQRPDLVARETATFIREVAAPTVEP